MASSLVTKLRADAQQNLDAVLEAAKAIFKSAGVDAPVRDIAERAGVGVATLYRRFPQRSDLVAAVFRREVDSCAAAAAVLARGHEPEEALLRWLRLYTDLIATKRGLAAAMQSDDPAYVALREYFVVKLEPALASLLAPATKAGAIRDDIDAYGLMRAIGNLLVTDGDGRYRDGRGMVAIFVDGLRRKRRR